MQTSERAYEDGTREAGIPNGLDQVQHSIDMLAETVAKAEKTLDQIMRPSESEPDGERGMAEVGPARSETTLRLGRLANQIDNQRMRLSGLLDRVEF
jgi:hypothetical protein